MTGASTARPMFQVRAASLCFDDPDCQCDVAVARPLSVIPASANASAVVVCENVPVCSGAVGSTPFGDDDDVVVCSSATTTRLVNGVTNPYLILGFALKVEHVI